LSHVFPTYAYSTLLSSFPTRRSSDLSPAEAKPVIRRDLDRAVASEQVVSPAHGRHLDAALVDLVNLVWQGHAAVRAPATKQTAKDRKSTRLNSSHVKISYAVFCLKKK